MLLADLIIAEAQARGIRHFFGIPGGGLPLDLVEAARTRGLHFVNVNHESSAAIMAAYYGHMKGTAGLALAIRGVGAGNLVGGVVNAYFERVPVVAICEAAPTSVGQREMAQYCDHFKLFRAGVKYSATLTAGESPHIIQEAVFQSTDGRPGPSFLNLPSDVGNSKCDGPLPGRPALPSIRVDQAQLAAARKFLAGSRRPVVIAGSDVLRADARPELVALAENIGAAVLVNMDARGVFPESHPRWVGVFLGLFSPNVVETELLAKADAVVLVGADPMMTHLPWNSEHPTCELVARPEYETLSGRPQMRVNGDLKTALKDLGSHRQSGFCEAELQELRQRILRNFERPAHARLAAQDIIGITRALLPCHGILFSETGAFICMLERLWPVDQPGTFYGTSGGRTMGLMLPAILGARLADPSTPMVGIGGDGSLLMRLSELEVFSRTGVAVPLVIMNDQALGTMKSRQKSRRMPDYGLDFSPVDFAAVARACGLRAATVDTPELFERELKTAMETNCTTLIDARVDPQPYQDSFGPTIGILEAGDGP